MLGWIDYNLYSGLTLFLVVLVFVGGLLVLLVRVASTVDQEQNFSWSISIFIILFLTNFFLIERKPMGTLDIIFIVSWIKWSVFLLYIICGVLVLSLALITFLVLSFKSSLRGL